MTYRELSKELGISASKLQMIESEVLKEKGPAALLGNFDDAKVRVIRVHCLFSMLGVPDDEAIAILKHEMDMRATLKKHVDSILSDDSNHSQAAIVMQNIRRECQDVDELDPVPFLQHIKEGGTHIDTMKYSAQISDLISSVIIYLCGFVLFIKYMMNKITVKSEERKKERLAAAASAVNSNEKKGGDR